MTALDTVLLVSDGALIEQSFIQAVGDAGKEMIFVGPKRPTGDRVTQLTKKYLEKYREAPSVSYFLSAFDAAHILFTAIESVAIQKNDGTLEIGRQALRKALYNTSAYPGVTGVLSCDQFGDCGNAAFNILRLEEPQRGIDGLESNIVHSWIQND